jgi:hypothetical protein
MKNRNDAIRLIISLPPEGWGVDRQFVLALHSLLKAVLPNNFLFDCGIYLYGTEQELAAHLKKAERFRPTIGLGFNAAYGLLLDKRPIPARLSAGEELLRKLFPFLGHPMTASRNVFADDLGVPVVLIWDHLIIHAALGVFGELPTMRNESRPGALAAMSSYLGREQFIHCVTDSGHIEVFADLGILPRSRMRALPNWSRPPFMEPVVNGEGRLVLEPKAREQAPALIDDAILFAGNFHDDASVLKRYPDKDIIERLRDFVVNTKLSHWTASAWPLFVEAAARERANGVPELDPNHT